MKLSKKLLLYIGITAYVFVAGIMGYVLLKQVDEKSALEEEITLSQGIVARINPENLTAQKQELQDNLDGITAQLEILRERLSHDVGNVAASELIFTIAASNNVEVIGLSAPGSSFDYLNDVPCDVIVINATVAGDDDDLVDFIIDMNSALSTGVIQSVAMNIVETDNQTLPVASVLLELYNYQGE